MDESTVHAVKPTPVPVPLPSMTLRQYFAGQAMVGLFSGPPWAHTSAETAQMAVERADALIAELERT